MIFGNKNKLALECKLEAQPTELFNCYICYWVKGMQIGNYRRGGSLKVLKAFYECSLGFDRYNRELASKSKNEAFKVIMAALYEDKKERTNEQIDRDYSNYFRFDISASGSPAFDGWQVFIVDDTFRQRCIWRHSTQNYVDETTLPLGTYEKTIKSFLAWSNPILQSS